MSAMLSGEDAPLTGVRVIDLTRGPLARVAQMLADLGAEWCGSNRATAGATAPAPFRSSAT